MESPSYVPMVELIPEGKKGVASIHHITISKAESDFTSIRAMMHGRDAFVPEGRYTQLFVGSTLMMSDTPMEKTSNHGVLRNAYGDVLIAGLGVGLILVPILRKADVKSVTVVEKYQDVVDIVEPALRANVPEAAGKLKVVTADIFTWSPPKADKWDTIYFDIWPDIVEDNLDEMAKLHRKYAKRKVSKNSWMDSWKRDQLLSIRRRNAQRGSRFF